MIRTSRDINPIIRIVEAVATSPCGGATIIPAAGGQPRKIRCTKFTAEIYDAVREGSLYEDLTATGESVTVWNKFSDPMFTGANLTLGLRADGRWTILVWECG